MEEKRYLILKDEAVKRLLDRMRALCAVRECCEKDIREKLAKALRSEEGESGERADETAGRRSGEEVTDAVIGKLKEEGFLSDRRYAAAFARDKAHLMGWGPQKIRHALLAKHIDVEIVNEALALVDSGAAENQLERILGKKLSSLQSSRKELACDEMKARLIRFAMGRGYPYDSVRKAVSKVLSGRQNRLCE